MLHPAERTAKSKCPNCDAASRNIRLPAQPYPVRPVHQPARNHDKLVTTPGTVRCSCVAGLRGRCLRRHRCCRLQQRSQPCGKLAVHNVDAAVEAQHRFELHQERCVDAVAAAAAATTAAQRDTAACARAARVGSIRHAAVAAASAGLRAAGQERLHAAAQRGELIVARHRVAKELVFGARRLQTVTQQLGARCRVAHHVHSQRALAQAQRRERVGVGRRCQRRRRALAALRRHRGAGTGHAAGRRWHDHEEHCRKHGHRLEAQHLCRHQA
eukprot:363521-Chlamydomonas_euryale.AAC.9